MQRSTDPPIAVNWQLAGVVTKSKGTVTGLTSGTMYWFRVTGAGQGP